jgi:hypothetical protein
MTHLDLDFLFANLKKKLETVTQTHFSGCELLYLRGRDVLVVFQAF